MRDKWGIVEGQKWARVHSGMGPRDNPNEVKRYKARESTMKNKDFLAACTRAEVEPTIRQARKWNMKKGLAWFNRK